MKRTKFNYAHISQEVRYKEIRPHSITQTIWTVTQAFSLKDGSMVDKVGFYRAAGGLLRTSFDEGLPKQQSEVLVIGNGHIDKERINNNNLKQILNPIIGVRIGDVNFAPSIEATELDSRIIKTNEDTIEFALDTSAVSLSDTTISPVDALLRSATHSQSKELSIYPGPIVGHHPIRQNLLNINQFSSTDMRLFATHVYPDDFDCNYFSLARQELRHAKNTYIAPGEQFHLYGLNQQDSVITGRIPTTQTHYAHSSHKRKKIKKVCIFFVHR